MIVLETPHGFDLQDSDNFRDLKLQLTCPEPETTGVLPAQTQALGRWDGPGRVFLDADLLRGLAGERAHDPIWQAKFAEMVKYAEVSGWLDADRLIQVHVDYVA